MARRRDVSAYIEEHRGELEAAEYRALCELEARLLGRIARLRRDRAAITGDADDEFLRELDKAIDEVWRRWRQEGET